MAYLAPIHRPSSIRHALKLSFTSPDAEDLVVAKANRLEIWRANPGDTTLVLQHSKAIYGKVTLLHKLRPATSQTDHLFVGTDRYNYFTLSWDDERQDLKSEKSMVDIAEKAARDSQTGDRVHIDPTSRFMTLEVYEGVVNVLPIAHAGKGKRKAADNEIGELGDPIQVRIPELFVRSSCFLYRRDTGPRGKTDPMFAVLYEDSKTQVRIKIRELEYSPSLRPNEEPATAELEKGVDVTGSLEQGSSFMIPLPAPTYGLLVVGETRITYVDEWEHKVQDSQPLEDATVFVAWCKLDEQRYILADDYKKLYLLMVITSANGDYQSLQIDVLGETSRASTLVYLDEGRVFVGSHQGDSQVIQISPKRIDVLQSFPNIAPILDFTVMDMGNRSLDAPVNEFSSGQARIVTGSGAFNDGSLRSVRSGVGLEDRGSLGDLGAPISSIFSLRTSAAAQCVDTLIVSHVSHTNVVVFTEEGDIEARDSFRGFELSDATLYAGSLHDGRAVQVTSSSVLLTDTEGDMVTDRWQAPSGTSITAVAADGEKILVSLQGAALVVLDLSTSNIQVQTERKFGSEEQVSCITLSSSIPNTCVAGFWKDSKVSFLSLQDLQPIASETVAEDDSLAVPRSLIVANVLKDQPATLFIGLADGNVVTYSITSAQQPFSARKSIILGTQQANFAALPRADGLQNVFATCEHPSLIYGSDGRLVYSAVTAENATCIASFDSFGDYSGAIAIATTDEDGQNDLKIAIVDEERTTHVQDLFIHETVRRIAYSAELKAFGLGCIKRTLSAGNEEVESHFKLVDEVAFKELDTWALNEDELIECVIRCHLDDGSGEEAERFVIGTAYLDDQDANNARGRILVLEITEDRRIKLVTELAVRGACRCLAVCQGRIVAALVKTIVVYEFEYQTASTPALTKKASYRTATAPIDICVTNNTIAVTDLMKSLSLLEFQPGRRGQPDSLIEIARHFETLWGTACARVTENTYLESDAEGNLIVLQHDINGFSSEDRRRLRVTSEFLLGEMVNRIRPIAVQPSPGAVVIPQAFLATTDGSIYVYCEIGKDRQDLLMRMQTLMAEMVKSPGGVRFAKFRGFKTQVRDMGEEGPVRFVDGELIERFLDMPEVLQNEVVKGLEGTGVDLEGLRGMVEGLRRVH
ncbi:DNA damage-binding protein 1b [Pseudocercospora fuligena]|uniref:DNA damage-binding protein 1b n=1 Tax=Pseudocercospora fuligena TaxID=685502 RepID=A0A8H6RPL1_9PEZI|nr:DNA damage-binding protein 1b [Pseudocercospora fuligena]